MPVKLILVFPLMALLFCLSLVSCGPAAGSSSSITVNTSVGMKMKMKNYVGAASIGDFVSYTIDDSNKVIYFSNFTRHSYWSADYTMQADGSAYFNIPVIDQPANFIEVPDKVLAVSFKIWINGYTYPAIAVLAPNTVLSNSDMPKIAGVYFDLTAIRMTDPGYGYGTYSVNPSITYLTATNWATYNNQNVDTPMSNEMSGAMYFSNNAAYAHSPDFTGSNWVELACVANGYSYVCDYGIGAGFSFGLVVRTNLFTTADMSGNYVIMMLEQQRNSNTTNMSTNYSAASYVFLSNTGTCLDVYLSPSNSVFTTKVDALMITNVIGDIQGILPPKMYFLTSTNTNSSGSIFVVPSSDLSMGCLTANGGDGWDTNHYYHAAFGFIKKLQ